jgi:exo-beta-1,3-glucanase (GH17 family)/cellulose synthase/poly-beta-1,6-N-acetylglucosamine synthase-like glycosyltransferase
MRTVAAVIALVACAHAGLWALTRPQAIAPDVNGQLASVSYAPFQGNAHPDSNVAQEAQIRSDLAKIAPLARSIRTYSSTGGVELVPGIAQEFGLRVTVGAWIDKFSNRNEQEIKNAIELAKRHSNVKSIVVGNETIYRADQTVDDLIKMIQRVKRANPGVPVTTGEIWNVWIEHPELATAVDYIAAHILPYWEGFPDEQAVDQAILIYDKLRETFPGKRIVIAEFGWPSAGYNLKKANPGRVEQAKVLRTFVSKAESYGLDYNIVEAIDQPWKTFEGGVGPYWGMLNDSREAKFDWRGPITDPAHWKLAGIAILLGVLLSLPILGVAAATTGQAVLLAGAANLVGGWLAIMVGFWTDHYFMFGSAFAYGLGVLLLIPLLIIALARVEEIAVIAFGRKPSRLLKVASALPVLAQEASPPLAPQAPALPKVSIHIPAYREPPEMLRQTLDAIAKLEYPNFECIVIINNTPDPTLWKPIEEHCQLLGERFKFVNVDNLKGFKAGALRLALSHTAPDAEIIGVIDADYVVHPDWLRELVPTFADPTVGLVQAPQDHRDGDRSLMHYAMNREYAGFFDIGMVQRNEYNAIIVHGTMCLIRREALNAVGGWSSDTICEDTDLGLSILEAGWQAHYTTKRYGHGLLPDNFDDYKKQRHRWAYGGFQIIKKHWRYFLPGASRLTRDQKREFALGWLNWLGAESLGVAVALLNIIWVPVVAFLDIAVPDRVLTLPIMATFALSVAHFVTLYRLRVRIPKRQMFGAVCAAMSVQWTVARAIAQHVLKDRLAFVRTAKGGALHRAHDFHAFWEAVIATLLILGALVLFQTNVKEVREINLFAIVLLVQAVPFVAASLLAAVEHSRLNDFAYWRALDARFAELLPLQQRPAIAEAPVAAPAVAAAPPAAVPAPTPSPNEPVA